MKDLKKLLERVKAIEPEFDAIVEETSDLDFYFDDASSKLMDAIDALSTLREELISRTDGRPLVLDFSNGKVSSLLKDFNEAEKSEHWHYKNWARCSTRGFKEKAFIGRHEASMEDLIKIRDWINAAIEYHQTKPND